MKRLAMAITGIVAVTCLNTAAWADTSIQTIKVYENPSITSPVVETIKSEIPLITIYQNNGWEKVGDTTNGNTGWIQSVDRQMIAKANTKVLPDQTTNTVKTKDGEKSVTKGVLQTPQGPFHYEIVQFQGNNNQKVDKHFYNAMQKQQLEMNQAFANSWNTMGNPSDFNTMQSNMAKLMHQQQQKMLAMQQQFQQAGISSPTQVKLSDHVATPAKATASTVVTSTDTVAATK
ncbi:SH3 domain-containing protein [Photobacterium carnosum]|uniref:SH3 domain-containing protein n=1 Tax=Photobacterium carnosum TaxID=2023717 RepID=UPI001E358FD5|nr:SH3 domain-containing protein [Photobacterium carnosum]MCD9529826.1 SH3 domain-containing protein [Photobacterium carnosum]MCF2154785.1 SH3 domain-containing protein [Photobacterium carnosum]MCF2216723.1 SH3 domain-containing protein [Photobacterium carnosum]